MNSFTISFVIESSQNPCPFKFAVAIDGHAVEHVSGMIQAHVCTVSCADDENEHVLEISMLGKTVDHTKIDSHGNIVNDILVTVSNMEFDGVALGHVFLKHTTYSHDFNGTRDPVTMPFAGVMGCNGVVRFRFKTPCYLWLLENL
jgi:hypothetical protein